MIKKMIRYVSLAVLIVVGGLFALLIFGPDVDQPSGDAVAVAEPCSSPADADRAYFMAQVFIEERLKAPSSAEFGSIHNAANTTEHAGDCNFVIKSWVDSQNEFGAMIRTHYVARMQKLPDERWALMDLAAE